MIQMEVLNIWISCRLQFFTPFIIPSLASQRSSDVDPILLLFLSSVAEMAVAHDAAVFVFATLRRLSERTCDNAKEIGVKAGRSRNFGCHSRCTSYATVGTLQIGQEDERIKRICECPSTQEILIALLFLLTKMSLVAVVI